MVVRSKTDKPAEDVSGGVPMFQAIVDGGEVGILVLDENDTIEFANKMFSTMTGLTPEELTGKRFTDFLVGENRKVFKSCKKESATCEEKLRKVIEVTVNGPSPVVAEMCCACYVAQEGKNKTFVYLRDIAIQRQLTRELRQSEKRYRELFENIDQGISISTREGKFIDCNPAVLKILGYDSKEEFLKLDISNDLYVNPQDRKEFQKLIEKDGYVKNYEVTFKKKNGDTIPILLTTKAIKNEKGEVVGYQGLNLDISERIRMEQELRETQVRLLQSEKMASLGSLAAGVAHEINNPLGGILIYASLLMEDFEASGDPRVQDLKKIVDEASRCKEIVKSLLEFGRQTESRFEPIDVNKAIVDGLFFLEKQVLFHDITIIKHLDQSLPAVNGDPNQIKQVFMNMMVNAAEAMSERGGALTITTGSAPDESSIFISFKDEGTGIPPEIQPKIFDPFFTTKGVGKGTGLGLSTSYGIIQSHHGTIDVESQPGTGTAFTIHLPRSGETAA